MSDLYRMQAKHSQKVIARQIGMRTMSAKTRESVSRMGMDVEMEVIMEQVSLT